MNVVRYKAPGGIERLGVVRTDDPGAPGPNEIRVRIHGSSLNGHDYNVALGILPVGEGRVLMSDGAGEVEAVGSDVTEFAFGDHVVSTFFPDWQSGDAPRATFARTPGDGIDGYAAEAVVQPANFFTRMPHNWNFTDAATLPTAGLTAWRESRSWANSSQAVMYWYLAPAVYPSSHSSLQRAEARESS